MSQSSMTGPTRVFGLKLTGHRPMIIACDGQPVTPHAPPDGAVVLGPAMRVDLILDMTGRPGERFQIQDDHYRGLAYRLVDIVYDGAPLRERPPDTPIALPAHTMPEPDIANAERHEVTFNGGMMGQAMQRRGMGGMADMMEVMRSGRVWYMNGVAAMGHAMEPMLTSPKGRTAVIAMSNETTWCS